MDATVTSRLAEPDDAGPQVEQHRLEFVRPYLYPKQRAAIYDPRRISVIEASTKAQPLDAVVQTPDGPRKLGDLKLGSRVFAADGSVARVRSIYPRGRQAVYRLTFSDGAQTRASGDHLWSIEKTRGLRLVTTEQLASYTRNTLNTLRFPLCSPLEYPDQEVPIDPWLLGVLIGDGGLCSNVLTVSTADPEIVERVQRALPPGYFLRQGTKYQWIIAPLKRGAAYERRNIRHKSNGYEVSVGRKYVGRRGTMAAAVMLHEEEMALCYGNALPKTNLRRALRELGLLGLRHDQKFVPEVYLRNSVNTRREILRGIMDTDGSAGRANGAILEQTSERLAKNVIELVQSLGGVARMAIQEPRREGWKRSYRINIRHNNPESLFWLPRKAKVRPRCRVAVSRTLRHIDRIEDDEVACIGITHPSGLYLTDDHIVTHNSGKTSGCIVWLAEQAFGGRDGQNFWWVAPVSGQADIAFRRMQRAIPRELAMPNITLKALTLTTGAVVWFRSADKPDSLYGEDVYAGVVDEASRSKEDAWNAFRTTLTATRGPVRIIGNVKGRKNWFYRMARRAEAGDPRMGYHKIVAADAVAAGVLEAEEIEDARRDLPERVFNELYLAQASDDEGNPFGLAAIRACISPLSSRDPVCWGWDLAKHVDWSVGIGLDEAGYVCRFHRFQLPWEATIERILEVTGFTPALVDSTGVGDPIVEILQKRRPAVFDGFRFNPGSKQKLMEGLAVAIQSKAITYPDGPIVSELEQFEYQYTRASGVRYGAPEGFWDDCVCSLALAVMHKMPGHARRPMQISDQVLARAGMRG